MNKAELIKAISEKVNMSQNECEKALAATLEAITQSLANGK